MDHTLRALRISEKVADGIPVPGLKSAINVALHIAEMAEEAKNTRETCRELAERAGKFTLAVYEHLRACGAHVQSHETTEHVANFLCTLEDIEAYMSRQGRKGLFSMMRSNARKVEDIARLTTKLEDAVRMFNIQTSLHSSAQLSLIADAQSRLLTHADDSDRVGAVILSRTRVVEAGVTELVRRGMTDDGTLKLFGREDIDLLDELGPEVQWPTSGGATVMRYLATLRRSGNVVVVRRFPRNDTHFRSAVELTKRIWHPYIVQTLGVSRPDPHQAFIVQDGMGTNGSQMRVLMRNLQGLERLNYVIDCMRQLSSAFDYMETNGKSWPSQNSEMHDLFPQDLTLRSNGRLQWDLSNWGLQVLPTFVDFPRFLLHFDRDLLKVLRAPASDNRAALKHMWTFLSQANPRNSCCNLWDLPIVPNIGQCFLVAHIHFPSARYTLPATVWRVKGPQRHCCFFSGLEAMQPGPFFRAKSCERQTMFAHDPDEGIIVGPGAEDGDGLCGDCISEGSLPSEERTSLPNGWIRHTVDMSAEGPVLGFKLTVSGASTKDTGRWLAQQVTADDTLCESAADLAVAVKIRICISTGRNWQRPQAESHENSGAEGDVTGGRSGDPRSEGPQVLYFYENYGTPRSEGVFETPVGYWSTSPDDAPSAEEMDDVRVLRERRHIEYGGYSDQAVVWVQELGELRFLWRIRVYINKCHFSRDECALLREIRPSLNHHVCEASVAFSHETDDW